MGLVLGGAAAADVDRGPASPELLDRLAGVAARYRDEATHFTCTERIRLHTDAGRRDARFVYLYRDEGGVVQEGRVLRPRYGEPSLVSLADYGFEGALLRPYSWVFLFESARRGRFDVTVEGEARLLGRPALRLRVEPRPPVEAGVNDWFATMWVERDALLPLRVEARTPAYEGYWEAYRQAVRDGGSEAPYVVVEDVVTEFGVRERGMRFPSEATVTRWHYELPASREGARRRAFLVRQLFDQYRFYDVRAVGDFEP